MAKENGVSEPDGINEISRLLLQGWTMLADTCPRRGCHMPLMRSRQGRVICCTCRADVVTETPSGGSAGAQASNAQTSSDAQPTIETLKSTDTGGEPNTTDNREAADLSDSIQASKETGVVSTHVAQPFAEPHDPSSSAPGTSDSLANANVESATERSVVPVNVSANPAREVEHLSPADRLRSSWVFAHEECPTCGTALLRNVLDDRKECLTCRRTANPELTHVENPAAASRDVGVVRASNEVQIAPRQNRDLQRTTGAVVPSTGREPRRSPVAPPVRAQRAGVGVGIGGSGGMLDVGSGAGAGLGARRITGRAAVGDVPTLEPRPTAANADPDEYLAGDVEFDVDRELVLAELAVARNIHNLRCALADASDAESIRALCAAIVSAANAVTATRRARQARSHVHCVN